MAKKKSTLEKSETKKTKAARKFVAELIHSLTNCYHDWTFTEPPEDHLKLYSGDGYTFTKGTRKSKIKVGFRYHTIIECEFPVYVAIYDFKDGEYKAGQGVPLTDEVRIELFHALDKIVPAYSKRAAEDAIANECAFIEKATAELAAEAI